MSLEAPLFLVGRVEVAGARILEADLPRRPACLLDMMEDLRRHPGPGHRVALHHRDPLGTGRDPLIVTSAEKLNAAPAMDRELLAGGGTNALALEGPDAAVTRMTEGIASILTSQLRNIVVSIGIQSNVDQNLVTLQDASLSEGIRGSVEARDPRDEIPNDERLKDTNENLHEGTLSEGRVKDMIGDQNDVKDIEAAVQNVGRTESEVRVGDRSEVEERIVKGTDTIGVEPTFQKIGWIQRLTGVRLMTATLIDKNTGGGDPDMRSSRRGPRNVRMEMGWMLSDGTLKLKDQTRFILVV